MKADGLPAGMEQLFRAAGPYPGNGTGVLSSAVAVSTGVDACPEREETGKADPFLSLCRRKIP